MSLFVLVHSPLVGPLTWKSTADALHQKGYAVVVPSLYDIPDNASLYWQRHATAVRQALSAVSSDQLVVLAGHSGAGPLLPAIRRGIVQRVAAYVFIDAGLPRDNASRLDSFESPEAVAEFRQSAVNGLLPTWADSDLAEVIPNADVRRQMVTELRPMPLAVYEEPLPVFAGWPDAPCGYIRFSPVYDSALMEARQRGWPLRTFDAGHCYMLVEPGAVAAALIDVCKQMSVIT
ncbi:MAG: alpha/beta fold hydrolase [Aggregatilineales bacterium]